MIDDCCVSPSDIRHEGRLTITGSLYDKSEADRGARLFEEAFDDSEIQKKGKWQQLNSIALNSSPHIQRNDLSDSHRS
jgi:hypothetical protein